MNENDNKYVNEVLKKLNELNAVERFPMNDREVQCGIAETGAHKWKAVLFIQ